MPNLNIRSSLKRHKIFIIPAILLCLTFPSHAEIYKWTDENGNTHYSDIKPNHANSETLKIKTSKSRPETKSPQQANQELTERNQAELEAKAQQLKDDTQKRELDAQCEAIRNNIKTMEENSRIKITENNETRFLSQEEVEAKKAKFQQDLQEFCTP